MPCSGAGVLTPLLSLEPTSNDVLCGLKFCRRPKGFAQY